MFYTGKLFRGKFGYTLIKTQALKKTWQVQYCCTVVLLQTDQLILCDKYFFSYHYSAICKKLQYSSQIVETDTVSFLNFLTQIYPSPSPRRILEHWYDCNTQINIGEGETHTCFTIFNEYCSCVNLTRHWNGVSKNVLCIEKTQGNRSSREHSLSKDSWSLSDIPLVRTGLSSSELLLSSWLYS